MGRATDQAPATDGTHHAALPEFSDLAGADRTSPHAKKPLRNAGFPRVSFAAGQDLNLKRRTPDE